MCLILNTQMKLMLVAHDEEKKKRGGELAEAEAMR